MLGRTNGLAVGCGFESDPDLDSYLDLTDSTQRDCGFESDPHLDSYLDLTDSTQRDCGFESDPDLDLYLDLTDSTQRDFLFFISLLFAPISDVLSHRFPPLTLCWTLCFSSTNLKRQIYELLQT